MTTHGGDAAISSVDAFGVEEGYKDASGKVVSSAAGNVPRHRRRNGPSGCGTIRAGNATGYLSATVRPSRNNSRRRRRSADDAALRDLPLGYHMLRYAIAYAVYTADCIHPMPPGIKGPLRNTRRVHHSSNCSDAQHVDNRPSFLFSITATEAGQTKPFTPP
jgi:hypothetical protein